MSKDPIEFDIRGMTPRPYSTSGTEPWRKHILDFVNQERYRGNIPGSHLQAGDSNYFEVWIIFHLPSHVLLGPNPSDIDNLSKTVLDSLFLSPGGKSPYKGALYKIDDHHVWKLHLEKRLVESEKDAGVSIIISILQ